MAALFTGRAVAERNNVIVEQYKLSDMSAVGWRRIVYLSELCVQTAYLVPDLS